MSAGLAGLAPVFVIIAIGWGARASGLVAREAWGGVNRAAYWIMYPSVLFTLLARADFQSLGAGPFLVATACAFAVMGALALGLRPLLSNVDGPAYTSLFQASVRWNGFVLLAAAPFVFDAHGQALTALIFAPAVPLVNVMCVGVLSVWGSGRAPAPGAFALRFATNPLILSSVAGGLWGAANLPAQGAVFDALELIGRAGLAAALLSVGAGLDLGALRARPRLLALSAALKMAVMPLVFFAIARAFGLDPLATAVLVAAGATPGAAASYVLARELGGDAELMAGHVTATTLLAALVMPAALALAGT